MSKVVFSGIKPSGNLHIGNYIGAVRQWALGQDGGFNIFCVVDMHAITVPQDPKVLHEKTLEIVGTGYRAAKLGDNIVLNVGYSHPVIIEPAGGIQLQTRDNKIIVLGADKILVGETAAKIRRVRPPEPYKGKGIRYAGEIVRRKAGKAVKTTGGSQV